MSISNDANDQSRRQISGVKVTKVSLLCKPLNSALYCVLHCNVLHCSLWFCVVEIKVHFWWCPPRLAGPGILMPCYPYRDHSTNWPVPFMTIAGPLCHVTGWWLRLWYKIKQEQWQCQPKEFIFAQLCRYWCQYCHFPHKDIDNIDRFGNIIEDIGDINDDDKELRKATGGRSQYLLTVADTKY